MLEYLRYKSTLGYNLLSSFVSALIVYTDTLNNFVYDIDGSGNAILTNQGSGSSTYDGLLNTGRGIELGAGNDLAFTVGSNWITWFDFADGEFHKQTGNKTFNTITINNILISASEPSASAITALNANPGLMAKLAMSGTGSIDELDLTLIGSDEWYPCSESKGAFVFDARGYEEDSELFTNPTFDTDLTGWSEFNAGMVWESNAVRCSPTHASARIYQDIAASNGDLLKLSRNVKENADSKITQWYLDVASASGFIFPETGTGIFTDYYEIVDDMPYARLYIMSAIGSNVLLDDMSIKVILSSYGQITNYAETIRANADFQTKGLQTTCLVLEGIGVPTAYDETQLHFYGNGYVDTQWNPTLSTPWTLTETIDTVENVVVDTDYTNENATYLFGKGTYQKVAADPYTIYEQSAFQVEEK